MTTAPTERESEDPWAKLRRRKVVQWGIAYAVGAWGLLQGLEYVSEAFHWPEQLRQVAILALVIGLPIVLVLAWYHGDRGQQRVSGSEFAILVLLLLAGGGIFWWHQRAVDDAIASSHPAATRPSVDTADARPSIAVLPFENRSRLEEDIFFVDGIHDDILMQLSKVSALRVISRTSVEQFRDTELPIKAIADQLGVTKIIEGGVQRAGDRVRIHVQLIDAGSDMHLWADRYDRALTAANIFEIQSEVATAIAGALQASLTEGEQARVQAIPTQSLEAWLSYQLGKKDISSRTSAGLTSAEGHFRKAIALDPNFAHAWVGLADAMRLQVVYAGVPQNAALKDAESAVARALELDPNLAEAWATAGGIANQRLQSDRAEAMLRRAVALNPNYAPAHHWLSLVVAELGRRDEALALQERAVVLDPRSAVIYGNLGFAMAAVGRFADALVAFRKAIEIDPTMPAPYEATGHVLAYGFGQVDAAIAWYEKAAALDPGNPDLLASLAAAHWDLGDDAEAGRWLTKVLEKGEGTAGTNVVAGLLFLSRGDETLARKYAQRAAELDPWNMFLIRDDDLRRGDFARALARYEKAFPDLFVKDLPKLTNTAAFAAVELALVLQHTGERKRASALLDRSEAYFRTIPRMGGAGYRINDVAIHALRGDKVTAMAKLREAEQAGWCQDWRYHRQFNPDLASIRNEPQFKGVFADIERDMAQQRARLAARPKDAPLELTDASR